METEIKERLVAEFRKRAERLRKSAVLVLLLVLISLGFGIYLFVFSGNIAINEIAGLKIELAGVSAELKPITKESTASTLGETFKALNNRIETLEEKVARTSDQTQSQIYLVSTVTTRVGSVLILLFLVQILVSLYRYNIRLAAYYDARADGLELVTTGSSEQIESIVRALSPESIDFGKSPMSPATHAVDLAKEILAIKGK